MLPDFVSTSSGILFLHPNRKGERGDNCLHEINDKYKSNSNRDVTVPNLASKLTFAGGQSVNSFFFSLSDKKNYYFSL